MLEINKKIYSGLSDTEKNIIDFIFKNKQNILNMSITNIAKKTYVSVPTVSRTIQKCGFNGISDLRYKIMSEESRIYEEQTAINAYNVNSILQKVYTECNQTLGDIVLTDILKMIEFIRTSKNVYICALGSTGLVAEEFQKYLQVLKINAILVTDNVWLKKINSLATPEDLVVILSVRGKNDSLVHAAHLTSNSKIPVVTCCCNNNSLLKKYSDIFILGHTEKIMEFNSIENYSRIPLMIITRIVTEYLG